MNTFIFCLVDRQAVAELLAISECIDGQDDIVLMIKGSFYITLYNCSNAHITADRQRIQPYVYISSVDILLRAKDAISYRDESGQPVVLGCLLLFFLLRHNKMLSIDNIKAACNAVDVGDVNSGWKEAVAGITDPLKNKARLQKGLSVPKGNLRNVRDEDILKTMERQFGGVCKTLVQRMEERRE